MDFFDFLKLLKKKQGTVFTLIFMIIVAAMAFSLLSPLKYGAKSRLLVVQNTAGTDPYTVSRSNEYLGNLLSQVVYSASFYEFVSAPQYNVDKNYFPGTYNQQLRAWKKTVKTRTFGDTGIIEISVYHRDPSQAKTIAAAVNDVLLTKNSHYQGNSQGVKINTIDQPLVSPYPVKPNLAMNLILALIAGLLFSSAYIYLYPEEKYDLKLWSSRREKKIKPLGGAVKIDDYEGDRESEEEEKAEASDVNADYRNKLAGGYRTEYYNQNQKDDKESKEMEKENNDNGNNNDNDSEYGRPQGNIENILK